MLFQDGGFIVYAGAWRLCLFKLARCWCVGQVVRVSMVGCEASASGVGIDWGAELKIWGWVYAATRDHWVLLGHARNHTFMFHISTTWLQTHVPQRWWEVEHQSFIFGASLPSSGLGEARGSCPGLCG